MSEEPEHITRTRELRAALIHATNEADRWLRQCFVLALALGHGYEQTEPLRQAMGWQERHAGVTENSNEWEEVVDGVLP